MTFVTSDYANIKADILRDIGNQLPDAAVGDDSDYAVRASGEAAAIEGLYQHQQWLYAQIFPDTADTDNLYRHALEHGLTPKIAVSASGFATFSGSIGAPIPVGTALQSAGNIVFVTTAPAVIGSLGTGVVAITAVVAGSMGNLPIDTALTLSSAPAGISSSALVSTATTGGTDDETSAALLNRLLLLLRSPPQGGSKADYKQWAEAVPGVGIAYIYGQRTASNSVDIVILDSFGQLPTTPLIASVQAAIDLVRPVTAANSWVIGPTAVPVPITMVLNRAAGVLVSDVEPFILASLQAYFAALTPGDPVVYNKLVTLVLDITGIVDVVFSTPTANVAILIDSTHLQMATLGTVTIS